MLVNVTMERESWRSVLVAVLDAGCTDPDVLLSLMGALNASAPGAEDAAFERPEDSDAYAAAAVRLLETA